MIDCGGTLEGELYTLWTIGGGTIDAAIGEGVLQCRSSRESDRSRCLLEEALENRDLA